MNPDGEKKKKILLGNEAIARGLVENGCVFAEVNLRGGGEYGETWHRAGMLENKQHVFDAFIAAALNSKVGDTLKKNKVPVKVRLVPGMGHEVPSDRMVSTYRRPLAWLVAAK